MFQLAVPEDVLWDGRVSQRFFLFLISIFCFTVSYEQAMCLSSILLLFEL